MLLLTVGRWLVSHNRVVFWFSCCSGVQYLSAGERCLPVTDPEARSQEWQAAPLFSCWAVLSLWQIKSNLPDGLVSPPEKEQKSAFKSFAGMGWGGLMTGSCSPSHSPHRGGDGGQAGCVEQCGGWCAGIPLMPALCCGAALCLWNLCPLKHHGRVAFHSAEMCAG